MIELHKDNRVTDKLSVKCYEVDAEKRLKPTAFMDMAQEMAYQAAGVLHFGYDELIREGMAWVLSRMHIVFTDAPHWRDDVEIQTWSRGAFGPFFLRDFRVLGSDGNLKVKATSSWVVMDVNTRRMAKPEDVLPKENTRCDDAAIEAPAAKVMMPRGVEAEYVSNHKVAYSDIDLVGHTNNARYISWAMDCMESDTRVNEIEITFQHEAKMGETVSLYRFRDGDSTLIEGRTPESVIFCTRIRTSNK